MKDQLINYLNSTQKAAAVNQKHIEQSKKHMQLYSKRNFSFYI